MAITDNCSPQKDRHYLTECWPLAPCLQIARFLWRNPWHRLRCNRRSLWNGKFNMTLVVGENLMALLWEQ